LRYAIIPCSFSSVRQEKLAGSSRWKSGPGKG
jgi:hypothetical protein